MCPQQGPDAENIYTNTVETEQGSTNAAKMRRGHDEPCAKAAVLAVTAAAHATRADQFGSLGGSISSRENLRARGASPEFPTPTAGYHANSTVLVFCLEEQPGGCSKILELSTRSTLKIKRRTTIRILPWRKRAGFSYYLVSCLVLGYLGFVGFPEVI